MKTSASELAQQVTKDTGLHFSGRTKPDGSIVLSPEGHAAANTFDLVIALGWRSIEMRFEQGAFSGELVSAMGRADAEGRAAFASILRTCVDDAAAVAISVNGNTASSSAADIWNEPWKSFSFNIKKGQLPLGSTDGIDESVLILKWSVRAAAAVLALLPLDDSGESTTPGAIGLPEGAVCRVEVNRYERDRRNRAAALAIHGCACKACGTNLETIYGEPAANFVEVHHTTPVSQIGPGYIIDPTKDLVPLCPNCHSIVHRRVPPYSVSELRELIVQMREKMPNEH